MRVIVTGSRTWSDYREIYYQLSRLPKDTVIVHGDAGGADRLADDAAIRLGLKVEKYPANWKRDGKRAGYKRNAEMVAAGADRVLAFHHARSSGTQHTIDEARRHRIPVDVFTRDG